MLSEGQRGIALSFLSSLGPSFGSMMGSSPQAVVGVRRTVMVAPAAAQVCCFLPDGPGLSQDPPSPWSDCSVSPLKVCTVSKGKVLLLYPNCCSLERWVASLACV